MLNDPVKIDPEFKAVCPPLTKEERGELRESIKRDYICMLVSKAYEGYALNIPKTKLQINDISATPTFPRKRA